MPRSKYHPTDCIMTSSMIIRVKAAVKTKQKLCSALICIDDKTSPPKITDTSIKFECHMEIWQWDIFSITCINLGDKLKHVIKRISHFHVTWSKDYIYEKNNNPNNFIQNIISHLTFSCLLEKPKKFSELSQENYFTYFEIQNKNYP